MIAINMIVPADATVETYQNDAMVASFLRVLSIIDRTIFPRIVTFFSGNTTIKLSVAGRRAHLMDHAAAADASSCSTLRQKLVLLCRHDGRLKHQIQAHRTNEIAGYSISDLVNLPYDPVEQGLPGNASLAAHSEAFRFSPVGWPLKMPEDSDIGALVNAWRTYSWIRSWLRKRPELLGEDVLMVTTGGRFSREITIRFADDGMELCLINSERLGEAIATWRADSASKFNSL